MKSSLLVALLILVACSHPRRNPSSEASVICKELSALDRSSEDASGVIRECIARTPDSGVLELPPGTYLIREQLRIQKPITLRTLGKSSDMPKCQWKNDRTCAELIAHPDFFARLGLILSEAPGFHLEHIILNGNKRQRRNKPSGRECQAGKTNHYGFNMTLYGSESSVTKSVSKEGLCGTALQTGKLTRLRIEDNTFAANGIHTAEGLWSDGVTVGEGTQVTVANNEFFNNTDIDLILFSCRACKVHGNRIWHDHEFEGSAFAALMIGAGPVGDFTDSVVFRNTIDCGSKKRCGFGLYIGTQAWGMKDHLVFGGSVNNNVITNAQQGFNVDRTTGVVEIFDNSVTDSGGGTYQAGCGPRKTTALNISPESKIDRSKDRLPDSAYSHHQWDDCIPNWWTKPY